jgi:hypothetical protein
MAFEFGLHFVDRVFVELVLDVFVDGFAFADGEEVVAHDAGLEGAFFTVECGAPGVFGVRRGAPGAVGPDDFDVAEIEGRFLGVGDVGFTADWVLYFAQF